MKKRILFLALTASSVLLLSGCVARTYPLTRDRIDQDLSGGNRGYLTGSAPAGSEVATKDTRTVRVFEIELGSPFRKQPANQPVCPQTQPSISGESAYSESLGSETTASNLTKYTVGKNDTLQKISKKFYGTTKKWNKIYEANKDTLKGPDKVYPGQVLNIPDADSKIETLKEPKENLK
jgi:nucleoid-associated protein YgaU